MKSIAIKTNNSQAIEYLENNFQKINLNNVYFSCRNFKHFTNIIVHYKGNNVQEFMEEISTILSFLVIYEFEEDFLKHIISKDFFYFSKSERNQILDNCFNIIIDSGTIIKEKFQVLFDSFCNFLEKNNKIFLSGFVNFRLNSYFDILEKIVEDAVNSYILEKEYNEFISLLRLYINSSQTIEDVLHIVYSANFTIILDSNKNIINNSQDAFKAKFLSDISFSTNDYTLNTLLTLLPKKIFIHLIDNKVDEFITTLCLIFDKRLEICTDCNICQLYTNNAVSSLNNITD